jgi:hypothetical protein
MKGVIMRATPEQRERFKKWAAKCEVESLYPKLEMPVFGISWEPPEPQKLADIIRERLASIFRRGALG